MYSNNILNFQGYDNFKCLYKNVWKRIECTTYMYIYKGIYVYTCIRIIIYPYIHVCICTLLVLVGWLGFMAYQPLQVI